MVNIPVYTTYLWWVDAYNVGKTPIYGYLWFISYHPFMKIIIGDDTT